MKASEMLESFEKAGKRVHLVGSADNGVIVALDMEGRLFTILNGEVLNRVNPAAISGESVMKDYLNPGGDGLWPAPEGTTLGYQYATGSWRVSPGLRMARYQVLEAGDNTVSIGCEIDLINRLGTGIPVFFQRKIQVEFGEKSLISKVRESITYLGNKTLTHEECLVTPWTLCQFDCAAGCEVVFPCTDKSAVWDLYEESSDARRTWKDGFCHTATDGSQRYQIAMDERVPWIEFRDPGRSLTVRRHAGPLQTGQSYIDISDAPPDVKPASKGVRYSVYSDTNDFMEIEAVGGCPETLSPGAKLSIDVTTEFYLTN
ncbi:DUF6786 family protein [Dyadobacter sp. CY323]|uniref:DUF6786 family protein n=1 Tax=Dyadobacter sp. CY323 TaxID=2907302 RepID=UPI001F21EA97|nr:DUF6786 family protein [Dyadobacter sp. CY323]MCE6990192.1 hypothetical protein [Dyadobacter sp. CY323]